MPGRLLVKLASSIRHYGEAPAAREAREDAKAEADIRPQWEAWKRSFSFQDKWYCGHSGPDGCNIECPVESLRFPEGAGDIGLPKSSQGQFLIPAPWNRPQWHSPLNLRLVEIISGEYNNPNSPAKEDAESLELDEREYGWYMAREHIRAREFGRRSRLDDVCGGKAKDDFDWDAMELRGMTYDKSWATINTFDMRSQALRGILIAPINPFTDGGHAIDEGRLQSHIEHLITAGATALTVVPPFYDRVNIAQLRELMADIASASHLPIMYCNMPSVSGITLSPREIAALADVGRPRPQSTPRATRPISRNPSSGSRTASRRSTAGTP
ncbi:MAG: hypothetical protein LQ349_007674 [Xanthoria aureola]|nr:MAG: hypothetical protein LQ349_007674 [Xanthoria aureola]